MKPSEVADGHGCLWDGWFRERLEMSVCAHEHREASQTADSLTLEQVTAAWAGAEGCASAGFTQEQTLRQDLSMTCLLGGNPRWRSGE